MEFTIALGDLGREVIAGVYGKASMSTGDKHDIISHSFGVKHSTVKYNARQSSLSDTSEALMEHRMLLCYCVDQRLDQAASLEHDGFPRKKGSEPRRKYTA